MKHLKHKKGEHLHQIKKAPLKQAIPAPTTQWYFAYGSNMNRKRMFARNAVWNICTAGTLYNHRLVFNKKSKKASEGFANIIKSKEHEVELKITEMEEAYNLAYDAESARMELLSASAELKSYMEKQ